ncbi:MAG: serpin family protein [Actinomycetia bacterium]|nr:serpin family protein [Actinomycetes bacterium]
MKKRSAKVIILVLTAVFSLSCLTVFTGCIGAGTSAAGIILVSTEESDEMADNVSRELIGANNKFAFDIFRELLAEDKGKNIFISPFSITTALAMAYNGAETDTKDAMAEVLGFSGRDLDDLNSNFSQLLVIIQSADPDIELDIANSVWKRSGFEVEEDYLDRVEQYYYSTVQDLDFSRSDAPDIINKWIEDATRGKIDKMINEIDAMVMMYLINAIYFKGDWTYPFDEELTRTDDFYLEDGSTVDVEMMGNYGDYKYSGDGDIEAVRLPYGRDMVSMYIMLPAEGTGLDWAIEEITGDSWIGFIDSFAERELNLRMPRFEIEYGIKDLLPPLTRLGMGIAFTDRADFGGMHPDLYISRVDHKAVIEVNEKGSEAAAVTVIEMKITSAPAEPIEFTADRPFFFVISDDRTGTILFMGKVANPAESSD